MAQKNGLPPPTHVGEFYLAAILDELKAQRQMLGRLLSVEKPKGPRNPPGETRVKEDGK